MRSRADELTGTHKTAFQAPSTPHLVAMWPGGMLAKEIPNNGRLTVGRSPTCDISIDHRSVSREHAVFHGGLPIEVEDLGSTNGTTVDGVRVPASTRVAVEPGIVVAIGPAVLVVHGAFEPLARPIETRAVPAGRPGQRAVIVADDAMRELNRIVDLVAKGDLSVVLLGETGTGKDVLADAIHHRSPRASAGYVRLNCGALPDALLESELFGYERGAFTGAIRPKPGLFEVANGGTVFLDEIAELPLSMQVKLLRVLENHEITRVGGVRPQRVDVRIICATNRDLLTRVAAGAFRQDLYFRLNGITLTIPPLRERRSEIAPLAREFIRVACARAGRPPLRLNESAVLLLESHTWPGNVRELKNAIERAVVLSNRGQIGASDLFLFEFAMARPPTASELAGLTMRPPRLASMAPGEDPTDHRTLGPLRAGSSDERARIIEALSACHGNQTRAAKRLGMPRRTFVAKLGHYGLPSPRKP